MFSIGDYVIDKSGKIFSIEKNEDKDFGSGIEQYFVLVPSFKYDLNPGYRSFIPVKRADSLLKNILSYDEAINLIDSIKTIEPYSDVLPRDRKTFFTKAIASGDRIEILKVIKSLKIYKKEREEIKKPISDFDKKLLDNLVSMIDNELSLSLSIPASSVSEFINDRLGTEY